ncbi:fructose-6-phosphate aldolase [Fluviispira multicolorata]|uniref:Probable transaldolase n=1 Tax=Fluviispira multicolorata TaxID=2654512 RepID=A0A833JFH0_9BACT|nr:fructose-6-phosphate aldolase [Fluviispira multicolorata]KAB8030924.1 fructose-6-phosphate aldolase [Fluviispira multicolorata]
MKIFIDSADIKEIKAVAELGVCDGVTTNPSLIAKSGQDFKTVLTEIANIIPGPISAEVISLDSKGMIKEAEELVKLANSIVIKLPLTEDGLKACKYLNGKGIKTNVTLCFSVGQALLAAKAGATYVSPFIGRLDDIGEEGIHLIKEIRTLYTSHKVETKILAASIRNPRHVSDSFISGADVVTLPYKVLFQLYYHPLTEKGLIQFIEDWKNSGQRSILSQ